jgi:hypothetical protein
VSYYKPVPLTHPHCLTHSRHRQDISDKVVHKFAEFTRPAPNWHQHGTLFAKTTRFAGANCSLSSSSGGCWNGFRGQASKLHSTSRSICIHGPSRPSRDRASAAFHRAQSHRYGLGLSVHGGLTGELLQPMAIFIWPCARTKKRGPRLLPR